MIQFPCPSCGWQFNVDPGLAGKKGRCPKCKSTVDVPIPDVEPVETQLPPRRSPPLPPAASQAPPPPEPPPVVFTTQRVFVVDVDMPYSSMVKFIFKWTFAAGPTMIVLAIIAFVTARILLPLLAAILRVE